MENAPSLWEKVMLSNQVQIMLALASLMDHSNASVLITQARKTLELAESPRETEE